MVVRINKYGSEALDVTVTSKDGTAIGMWFCVTVHMCVFTFLFFLIAGTDYEAVSQTVLLGKVLV